MNRTFGRSPVVAGIARFLCLIVIPSACGQTPPRLPRENLLLYRTEKPEASRVQTVGEWIKRREEIVAGMRSIMGAMPGKEKRVPLDMQVDRELDCGSYLRRRITYASEPGSRVPAYLLIPKACLKAKAEKASAVLALHPTDDTVGHGVIVGLGRSSYPPYANELAEHGFVVLAPSYPRLANYQPDLEGLRWESGTLKAVWDNLRGLDLLDSLPYVSAGKYAAIGHSLGGHNAVFTGVFDERISVVISSCGFDSFLDYYRADPAVWKPGAGWTQTRYMPKLSTYRDRLEDIPFDFHELIGALAPRRVLIVAPLRDSNFRAESVDRIAAAARPVFGLYGHAERLRVEHPDCEHDFPKAMREDAYRLIEESLR